MTLRLEYMKESPGAIKPILALSKYIASSSLKPALREMVAVLVSKINGCYSCLDLHYEKALKYRVEEQKLRLLPHYFELDFFSETEKAALRWAENVTNVGETHVPFEAFEDVKAHFTHEEIMDLTMHIILMNSWNRLSIAFGEKPEQRKKQTV